MFVDDISAGSVDHEHSISIRKGLTDPECHKDDLCTYVTDIEHGESSFASSTSGYSSDDESTSSDEEDDDDDVDEGDNYLLPDTNSSFSSKWTTKNGYNLTTFDQLECGGKWAIDLPLPLPMWSKQSKPPLVIDKVRIILYKKK